MSVMSLDGEIWKDVVIDSEVYPYRISSFGRIKSLNFNHTGREKLMKVETDKDGYFKVGLYNKTEKRQKRFFIHRLVAIVFLENPDNLPCVNHKDEDKTNNKVENLEWCSVKYNTNYGGCIERRIETRKTSDAWKEGIEKMKETRKNSIAYKEGLKRGAAKRSKKVYQYDKELQLLNVYESTISAAAASASNSKHISACCLKKRKSHNGFIWSYEPLKCFQYTLFPLTEKKIS